MAKSKQITEKKAMVQKSEEPVYIRFRWWKEVWRRLKKNKMAMVSLVILLIIVIWAIIPQVFAPYGYDDQDMSRSLQSPSWEFPLGTDQYGRCIFSRIIYGSRISMQVGLVVISISLIAGGAFGILAAYYKKVDNLIMRFMDLFMAVPGTLLAIVIAATLGPGMVNLMIAVAITAIPKFARVVRSACLTSMHNEYIEAANSLGASNARIIFKHILPNSLSPIIVQCTLSVADAIIMAASLSFIGLGVQPPVPEWGAMLSGSQEYLTSYPYMLIGPGIAILLLALSFNILGDGLRDCLDPKLKT